MVDAFNDPVATDILHEKTLDFLQLVRDIAYDTSDDPGGLVCEYVFDHRRALAGVVLISGTDDPPAECAAVKAIYQVVKEFLVYAYGPEGTRSEWRAR